MPQLSMDATKRCTRFGEIIMTTEYNMFYKMKGNRKVNMVHVERLKKSMSQKQLIVPIIVNENMEIVDGQHRFESCRSLGLPVYYIGIEGYKLEDCHILNANNRTYKPEDFLEGYVELGYPAYKQLKDFRVKYPYLSTHLCMQLLHNGKHLDRLQDFKNGDFKVENYDKACLWAERIYDFYPYAEKFFTNRTFITALIKLFKHEKYDHQKMMQKLEYQSGALKHQAKEKAFMENLCEVYNLRTRDEDRIYPHELRGK